MKRWFLLPILIFICQSGFGGVVLGLESAYNLGMTSRAPEGPAYAGFTLGGSAGYWFPLVEFSTNAGFDLGTLLDFKFETVSSADIVIFGSTYNRTFNTMKLSLLLDPAFRFQIGQSSSLGIGAEIAPGFRTDTSFSYVRTNQASHIAGNAFSFSLTPVVFTKFPIASGLNLSIMMGYEFEVLSVTPGYPLQIDGPIIKALVEFL